MTRLLVCRSARRVGVRRTLGVTVHPRSGFRGQIASKHQRAKSNGCCRQNHHDVPFLCSSCWWCCRTLTCTATSYSSLCRSRSASSTSCRSGEKVQNGDLAPNGHRWQADSRRGDGVPPPPRGWTGCSPWPPRWPGGSPSLRLGLGADSTSSPSSGSEAPR